MIASLCVGFTAFSGTAVADAPDCSSVSYSGSGTVADPYQVGSLDQLQCINEQLDKNYVLTGDIDASETGSWNGGKGFVPIGEDPRYGGPAFTGSFDGQGHTISGLTIDRPLESRVGLFGYAEQATLEHVVLEGGRVEGGRFVGALAGTTGGSKGSEFDRDPANKVTVRKVATTTTVRGDEFVGGLIGYAAFTTVQESYTAGDVGERYLTSKYESTVGGFFGWHLDADASSSVDGFDVSTVEATYTTSDVSSTSDSTNPAGYVGMNNGTIERSYAAGATTKAGSNYRDGGFMGVKGLEPDPGRSAFVTESYWDTEATGADSSASGATGLTTAEMTGLDAKTNLPEFDYDTTWLVTDSYPRLRWSLESVSVDAGQSSIATTGQTTVSVTGTFVDGSTETGTGVSSYSSSDTTVATVDSDGTVSAVSPGTATITATWGGNDYTTTVTVEDQVDPVAVVGSDVTVDQFTDVRFDGSGSSDNIDIASFEWDFGDGETATGESVTHYYDTPGTFTATLTVRDAAGNVDSDTRDVVVQDIKPPAVASVTLTDVTDGDGVVTAGDTVQITATVADASTIATVEAYANAFDAGTVTLEDDGPNSVASDDRYSATFTVGAAPTEGDQLVSVGATDASGNGGSQAVPSTSLTVDTTAPSINGVTLTDITDGNGIVTDGDTVQITATVTDSNTISTVEADASTFDAGTVTLDDDGPNSAASDDQYSATLIVGAAPIEGDQLVRVGATDTASNGGKQAVASTSMTVDTTAPSISDVTLTDVTDENGIVTDGDTIQVTATVTDSNTISTIEADASAFDAGTVTLDDDGPDSTTADDQYSATVTVGSAPTEGDQSVSVDATDAASNGGSQAVASSPVTVDITAPVASSTTDPNPAEEGTAISFDASGSTDNNEIASYQWDFGDGTTATGQTATHTYADAGSYTARLTVTDAAGQTAAESITVSIESDGISIQERKRQQDERPPTADAGENVTVEPGSVVVLDGSNSTDDMDIARYRWDFTSDGTVEGNLPRKQTIYRQPGTYTATLTVEDEVGKTDSDTKTIIVRNDTTAHNQTLNESTTPQVEVSTKQNGTAGWTATVSNASADQSVDISVEASDGGTTDGDDGQSVMMSRLQLTLDRDSEFTLDVTASDTQPERDTGDDGPRDFEAETGARAVGYVTVSHTVPDENIDDVTLTVDVRKSQLEDLDTTPASVVVYREETDGWNRLPTTVVGESDTHYTLVATSPGLSVFTIASVAPAFAVTDAQVGTDTLEAGESAAVMATVENRGSAAGTFTVNLTANGSIVATTAVDIAPNSTRTVTLEPGFETAGTYALAVGEQSAGAVRVVARQSTATPEPTATAETATVTANTRADSTVEQSTDEPSTTTQTGAGFGPAVTLVAALLAIVCSLVYRRRNERQKFRNWW
ncbi:PKD domain-containing protein [Salinirubellus salinus]|uniref:PKD domain-containing protein n=1 Tax=Salinirubellus salinus TaxID=1364945 RepID=A0A9E7QZY5_9EURY|nr:PKD domain-containing protein [Salinirubellus salinus]UWM52764.1 PKD domain-containing protein [Salinirubellus salinus]